MYARRKPERGVGVAGRTPPAPELPRKANEPADRPRRHAPCLERVHDLRLARPPQVQDDAALDRRAGELGIAFFEYWLAVPANRIGSQAYSAAQLKTMQEVITLFVFAVFSVLYLKQPIGGHHAIGFALISAGAFFIFSGGR